MTRSRHADRRRGTRAVTQTEVLVVLGMIVILAGIAWPAIARYRERSNRIH